MKEEDKQKLLEPDASLQKQKTAALAHNVRFRVWFQHFFISKLDHGISDTLIQFIQQLGRVHASAERLANPS